jgi:trimethylamine:corrinoid methyltransferase-like protein
MKSVGTEGNYLAKKHTLQFAESEHWSPKILDRQFSDAWIRSGSVGLHQKAKAKALKILGEHKPLPLTSDISKQLSKMVEDLEKKVP